MKTNSILVWISFLFLIVGCKEDDLLGLPAQNSIPPNPPVIKGIENLNGAAIIYYDAPAEDDLLCVTASYEINGEIYTTKSSVYKDSLKVEGFGKQGEYPVTLKSVDKSRNESSPVAITVSPLESPIEIIYQTLEVLAGFGGIKVKWENETESKIIIGVLRKDSIGDWVNLENFYTTAKEGIATIRGLDTIPQTFGVVVRDRWDNYSDRMETIQTPLFEEELDKSKFREITPLPNDCQVNKDLPIRKIWDGKIAGGSDCFHSGTGGGIGLFVTFDMGQVAKLSRYKMWQRTSNAGWIYNHNNLKHYVVYGCQEITAEMRESGSLDGWDLLYDAHCYKPSGLPGTEFNDEDKAYILDGDEHEIPLEAPLVRYIRIHMLETWGGALATQIAEMTFWGQVMK